MREFFRPLRRKLGVLILLVACGVTAGWLRSAFYEDRFFINLSGKSINRIISSPEGIAFEMMGYPFDIFRPETIDMPGPRWNSRTISHYGPFYVVDLTRDLRWSGFQYREGKTVGGSPIFNLPRKTSDCTLLVDRHSAHLAFSLGAAPEGEEGESFGSGVRFTQKNSILAVRTSLIS